MSDSTSPSSLTVVEVAMEIAYSREVLEAVAMKYGGDRARACAMSNSVGGIGPLLKERIPAQAELGMEVIGVSLLYDSVWIQGFYQWGQIYIEKRKTGKHLREVLEDTGIEFSLEMPDHSHADIKVWKMGLGKGHVYLLDSPGIANVVYPGPEDAPHDHPNSVEWVENQKINQSWLVGRGALALLKALNKKADFIVQSETPTFFANHFLIMDAFQKDPFFDDTRYIFNDHTPLEYAHPVWNETQVQKARIDPVYARDKKFWNSQNGTIDVTRLLIGVSRATFGVSKKHMQVMRTMPSLKGLEDKITSITNGVDVRFWRDADYADHKKLSDEELIALKEKKKAEMVEWVWKRYRLWVGWRAKVKGRCFVNWTRRVTTYKRFDVLQQLLVNPDLKKRFLKTEVVVLVGGRLHQNDNLSQNVIFSLLDLVTREADLKDRVIVLDNYNIWDAPRIFHGVDATIMLADDGREASATGFMKAQVNGAMVIASNDGAIPESVFFKRKGREGAGGSENGFHVPYVNGQPRPEHLMQAFDDLDAVYKDPKTRARMIRASFEAENLVNIDRTAREMVELYARLLEQKPQ